VNILRLFQSRLIEEKRITEERLAQAAEELRSLKQQQAEGLKVTDMHIERAAKRYSGLQVKVDFFQTGNAKRMFHIVLWRKIVYATIPLGKIIKILQMLKDYGTSHLHLIFNIRLNTNVQAKHTEEITWIEEKITKTQSKVTYLKQKHQNQNAKEMQEAVEDFRELEQKELEKQRRLEAEKQQEMAKAAEDYAKLKVRTVLVGTRTTGRKKSLIIVGVRFIQRNLSTCPPDHSSIKNLINYQTRCEILSYLSIGLWRCIYLKKVAHIEIGKMSTQSQTHLHQTGFSKLPPIECTARVGHSKRFILIISIKVNPILKTHRIPRKFATNFVVWPLPEMVVSGSLS
jgi:hypothetical protein